MTLAPRSCPHRRRRNPALFRRGDGAAARGVEALLAEHDCDHLVFCGLNRFGSAVQWLTQWPVTAEAVGVLSPGERDSLFVQWVNHAPQARLIADKADVAWGGELSIAAAIEVLDKRRSRSGRIAYIGPLTAEQHARLAARYPNIANLTRAYTRLRQVKSAEELDWLRIGAHFTDLGMAALRDGLRPGLNERELGDAIERAYISQGVTNVIHYIGITSMSAPDLGVPRQFATTRRVQKGDVVVAEISAAFWDHPGRYCAVSPWASRARSIAICTRQPTLPSTRSPQCCALAPRRRK